MKSKPLSGKTMLDFDSIVYLLWNIRLSKLDCGIPSPPVLCFLHALPHLQEALPLTQPRVRGQSGCERRLLWLTSERLERIYRIRVC